MNPTTLDLFGPAHRDSKAGQESASRFHRGHCGCHHRFPHTRQGLFQPPLRLVAELRRVRHHDVVSLSHGERADAPRPFARNDLEGELPRPRRLHLPRGQPPRSPDWRRHDPRQVGIARWKQITAHQIPNLTFTMADYFTHHTAKEYVPCSEAQFAKLEELLALAPPADEPAHGFEIEWANGSVYLFAETNGCTGSLLSGSCNTSAN